MLVERDKGGWVYIMTNRPNGILYTGVTAGLVQRIAEHRNGLVAGFTKRYGLKQLVWFEAHAEIGGAITREKVLKNWPGAWKVRLISQENPEWRDLFEDIV
jgi:putative endonuclease